MPDGVLPGPAVAELICAFGAARDDLRDAMALWCQRLAQQLIVVKAATACDDDLHEDLLSCKTALRVAPWPRTVDAHRVVHRCGVAPRPPGGLPAPAPSRGRSRPGVRRASDAPVSPCSAVSTRQAPPHCRLPGFLRFRDRSA